MPLDPTLVGRSFAPTAPRTVSDDHVAAFARAIGQDWSTGDAVPATYPIVLAFEAMGTFLDDVGVDLSRIVHGEQRFAYERPLRTGDVLTATLTVSSLRSIGGNDIVGTTSDVVDQEGHPVCRASATLVHRGDGA